LVIKLQSSVLATSLKTFEVCVLIPYFQNLGGLKAAVKSISYKPGALAILVVDDGSTIPLKAEDLQKEVQAGLQLFILREPENSGITHALNAGLRFIQDNLTVPYIARLDCGDLCTPARFEKQVEFLQQDPGVALLGSWCIFRKTGSEFSYTYTTPATHPEIVKELYHRNVFIHPTVMFRTEILNEIGCYPEDFPQVEDYAFFMKIADKYKTAILPEFLVTCEINPQGISISRRREQLNGRAKVIRAFGKDPVYLKLGLLRLWLLKQIPYGWILQWKHFFSRPNN